MRRERCAIFDAIGLENAFAMATLLPMFDGGDPLGKTPPDSERQPFDPATAIIPYAAYTQDQLAYIVGYDQARSECFVANVFPTLPTTIDDFVTFVDPITPSTDDHVAAMVVALTGC
jgi:hypothetical protein